MPMQGARAARAAVILSVAAVVVGAGFWALRSGTDAPGERPLRHAPAPAAAGLPEVARLAAVSAAPPPLLELPASEPLAALEAAEAGEADSGAPEVDGGEAERPDASTPSEPLPPQEEVQEAPSAAVSDDPRLVVRWGEPGLCAEGSAPRLDREALLKTFIPYHRGSWRLFLAPGLSAGHGNVAQWALERAHALLRAELGARVDAVEAPAVFIYQDVEQLVDSACVNRATRGYHDGAIHVAGERDLNESLLHEYVHHVLIGLGVRKPMWLHEGLAMLIAQETWWRDPQLGLQQWLDRSHLPFEALVDAFPHTADELFAGAVYYQSLVMVHFVRERGVLRDTGLLVEQLAAGTLSPRAAFPAAAGREGHALEEAFRQYARQLQ